MAYEFHYTPTGTGVISGKEVLEQTEDAINDLSGQISGDVQTAIDTANNALNTANTASVDAQNAVNTASKAYTAATNAQNTANTAQSTAIAAQSTATAAQNDVDALENVVTGIDGRLTTTEGNVTNLTTRMGTAEGNIGNLQTAVSTAQATANSAQQTATTARGQAYVVRYASVAVSDNSTVPYTDLNNIDNIKANDLLLDINGKIYQISSVDTSNKTVSVTTPLTQLAVDSSVVHNSGNEDVNGTKTFKDMIPIDGDYLGDEASTNQRTTLCLRANRDTAGKSGAYITRFRQNRAQGALAFSDQQQIGIDFLENSVRTKNLFNIVATDWTDDVAGRILINSGVANNSFGSTTRKCYINELNPGALSMPDLDNGIDISGYITVNGGNKQSFYTPTVDGWISVALTRAGGSSVAVMLKQGNFASSGHRVQLEDSTATCNAMLPVKGGVQVSINSALADGIGFAYFYPCQGNV